MAGADAPATAVPDQRAGRPTGEAGTVEVIGTSLISGRNQIRVPKREFRFISTSVSKGPVVSPDTEGLRKAETAWI
ncbi:hypothetical protein [Amycolatopsis palatopharyngis]|uniref:hypothetical protein n=1 Tax=Amycolatopsis palatopharyngis TaxID=187982 RepID=UPI000E23A42A|nr:hypothetical protein [Amycolatopsis palatopharyngis]